MSIKKSNYVLKILDIQQHFITTQNRIFRIKSPDDVVKYVREEIGNSTQEKFIVIGLNTKNDVIMSYVVFKGSVNATVIHPREIFQVAILNNCSNIIIAHNHPSNDPTPSYEDINASHRIYEAGQLLGIEMLDHIIVTMDDSYSIKENGHF